jgi:DnaA family protein
VIGAQLTLAVQLKDTASFDTFFAGPNADIVAALRPLRGSALLFGPLDSGRTHLLQAVCRTGNGRYLPLSVFAEHGPAALEGLSAVPLLCLDDIDSVCDDRDWALALLRLLDARRSAGLDQLLSASAAPERLAVAMPDLRTRLSACAVYGLRPLSDEDRVQLLRGRALARGLELPEDVARWLLRTRTRSTGALLAELDQLDRASLSAKRRLTLPFVQAVLGPAGEQTTPG